MLYAKTYTCTKCGRFFTKRRGGVIDSPEDVWLCLRPVCDICKAKTIINIFRPKK